MKAPRSSSTLLAATILGSAFASIPNQTCQEITVPVRRDPLGPLPVFTDYPPIRPYQTRKKHRPKSEKAARRLKRKNCKRNRK